MGPHAIALVPADAVQNKTDAGVILCLTGWPHWLIRIIYMKRKTLLERAQAIPSRRRLHPIRQEDIEMSIAWMCGDVRLSAAGHVWGVRPPNALPRIALALREAYRKGVLVVHEREAA